MVKICFLCHGNICRSPMAEFIMKDLVRHRKQEGRFLITSAATSSEEIGRDMHPETKSKLRQKKISYTVHRAAQFTQADYLKYDYILVMDRQNIRELQSIIGKDSARKIHLLLSFTDNVSEIADPWYTGDFDCTYDDIARGCMAFLQYIIKDTN